MQESVERLRKLAVELQSRIPWSRVSLFPPLPSGHSPETPAKTARLAQRLIAIASAQSGVPPGRVALVGFGSGATVCLAAALTASHWGAGGNGLLGGVAVYGADAPPLRQSGQEGDTKAGAWGGRVMVCSLAGGGADEERGKGCVRRMRQLGCVVELQLYASGAGEGGRLCFTALADLSKFLASCLPPLQLATPSASKQSTPISVATPPMGTPRVPPSAAATPPMGTPRVPPSAYRTPDVDSDSDVAMSPGDVREVRKSLEFGGSFSPARAKGHESPWANSREVSASPAGFARGDSGELLQILPRPGGAPKLGNYRQGGWWDGYYSTYPSQPRFLGKFRRGEGGAEFGQPGVGEGEVYVAKVPGEGSLREAVRSHVQPQDIAVADAHVWRFYDVLHSAISGGVASFTRQTFCLLADREGLGAVARLTLSSSLIGRVGKPS